MEPTQNVFVSNCLLDWFVSNAYQFLHCSTFKIQFQGEYFCEVCDRAWATQEELDEHIAEHIKCHFEGCVYTASPKLVTLHIKLQHDTGVFDRIVRSYDEDEIKKWKEERRRNYPTLQNIENKLAQKKEMEERGERVAPENAPFKEGKGFSMKKGQHPNKGRGQGRERKRKRKFGLDNNQQFLSTASVTEDMVVVNNIPPSANENFSDEEWVEEKKIDDVDAPPNPAAISNVLLALSTSYASDTDDEIQNEQFKKPKIITSDDNNEQPDELKVSRNEDETPNIHVEIAEKKELKDMQKTQKPNKFDKKTVNKQNKIEWKASIRKRPLTLLEKLLSKEIKQERNFILQCVRYIIKENYFEDKKT